VVEISPTATGRPGGLAAQGLDASPTELSDPAMDSWIDVIVSEARSETSLIRTVELRPRASTEPGLARSRRRFAVLAATDVNLRGAFESVPPGSRSL